MEYASLRDVFTKQMVEEARTSTLSAWSTQHTDRLRETLREPHPGASRDISVELRASRFTEQALRSDKKCEFLAYQEE
ncbi:hypothetical protein R1flu_017070 [Riccia fluitans]|uniref:Uncharacterized protein n=1 Tax=Riccia fluitans TaxID=41844 RepID=A0ABD1YPM4_9MARC